MEGILAIIMVFGIPLSAIIGGYYIKLQKMKMENGQMSNNATQQLEDKLRQLSLRNEDLEKRLRNVEDIVADSTKMGQLESKDALEIKRQLDELKRKIEMEK